MPDGGETGTHTSAPEWDSGQLAQERERGAIACGLCSTLSWNLAVCHETAMVKHCYANYKHTRHKCGYAPQTETYLHVLFVYLVQG